MISSIIAPAIGILLNIAIGIYALKTNDIIALIGSIMAVITWSICLVIGWRTERLITDALKSR